MTKDDLNFFKKWFDDYCRSFYSSNSDDQKNISLKKEHTVNVCKNMAEIASGISLNDDQILLAETAALLHDIGRFPQYAKYKTFRDSISVNHGLLGADILIERKVLQNLPGNEQKIIIQAVRFHNAFSLPKKEKEEIILFIKLIRDADKLDIWRVFLDHYESAKEDRASAVGLGLPDTAGYSEDVLSCLYKKKIISLSTIKTLNDFKLLQLSWIFDLNFKPSFMMLSKRKYVERIAAHLPHTENIFNLSAFLNEFVEAEISSFP